MPLTETTKLALEGQRTVLGQMVFDFDILKRYAPDIAVVVTETLVKLIKFYGKSENVSDEILKEFNSVRRTLKRNDEEMATKYIERDKHNYGTKKDAELNTVRPCAKKILENLMLPKEDKGIYGSCAKPHESESGSSSNEILQKAIAQITYGAEHD